MAAKDEPSDPAEGDAEAGPIGDDPWQETDDEPAATGDDAVPFSDDDDDELHGGEWSAPSLTVFPPPDHDAGLPDTDPDTDPAGDADRLPSADDISFAGPADDVSFAGLEAGADAQAGELPFDDASADDDGFGEGSIISGRGPAVFVPVPDDDAGATVLGDELGPDDASVGESASESALFSAVVEESTVFDGSATGSESFSGDSQGIGDGAALAAELAAVSAAADARPRAGRPAESWPRQLAHIVLGGVLAIPVAYSILLWGFQKDPFKIAAVLPEGVRSLLPARVRAGRSPSLMPSLDRLPSPGLDRPSGEDGATLFPEPSSGEADVSTAEK
ncbi:MAG: hypothetical protein ACOYK7_02720 [Pirellulales bacterium]